MESIEKQTEDLRRMNFYIKNRIEQYKAIPPSRSEAFKFGFELENSIWESHFEHFMTTASDSPVMKIFQKLNGDDISHAKRIVSYMKENGIEAL